MLQKRWNLNIQSGKRFSLWVTIVFVSMFVLFIYYRINIYSPLQLSVANRKYDQTLANGKQKLTIFNTSYATMLNNDLDIPYNPEASHVIRLYQHMNAFKDLHIYEKDFENSLKLSLFEKNLLKRLEQKLFPYLKMNITHLEKSFETGRGIVIPVNNKYFSIALSLIKILHQLNCQLPIEIFYIDQNDLSIDRQHYLQSLSTSTIPITVTGFIQYVDIDHPMLMIEGWFIKPFAILFSHFQEILLLDADTIFLQNPSILFETIQYSNSGTGFFYDRCVGSKTWKKKIRSILQILFSSSYSMTLQQRRMFQGIAEYDIDSGVVLLNKQKHFYGLLMICLLNNQPIRTFIQQYFMGDKETFWLGLEMMDESYEFLDMYVGTIGNPIYGNHTQEENILCGAMVHFDDYLQFPSTNSSSSSSISSSSIISPNNTPRIDDNDTVIIPSYGHGSILWFQDSLLLRKRAIEDNPILINYTHIIRENVYGPYFDSKLCAIGHRELISEQEMSLLQSFVTLWEPDQFSPFKKRKIYKTNVIDKFYHYFPSFSLISFM
jgi:hypothetical protein